MSAAALISTTSFSERVTLLLEKVDYRRADSEAEKEAIYRLRYDAYLREGSLLPNFSKRLIDEFDGLPNAWLYGVFVDERLAGSLRLHVSTREHPTMPAAQVFPDFLGPTLATGSTVIDPTRFVADAVCARTCPELPYVTLRLAYMAAEYFEADHVLATVRSEHQAFYRRVFGHRAVCAPRPYLTLTKPLSLMTLHYPAARDRILDRYPFFHSTLFERRMLFERGPLPQRSPAKPEPAWPIAVSNETMGR